MATLNELFPSKPPDPHLPPRPAPRPLATSSIAPTPPPAGYTPPQLSPLTGDLLNQMLFSRATGQYNPQLAAALGPMFGQYTDAYGAGGDFFNASPGLGEMQYGEGGQATGINGMDPAAFAGYLPQLGSMNYNINPSAPPIGGGSVAGGAPPSAAAAAPAGQPAPQSVVPQTGGGYSGAAGTPLPSGGTPPPVPQATAPISMIGHADPFPTPLGGITLGGQSGAPPQLSGGVTPLPNPYQPPGPGTPSPYGQPTGPQRPVGPQQSMWQPFQAQSSLPSGGSASPGTPLAGQQRTPLGRRYIPGGY